MSHDFNDEPDRSNERRSRRNPRMKEDNGKDLKVFDDSAVHPINRGSRRAARETAASSAMPAHVTAKLAKRKRRRRIIAMIVAECFALLFIFGYAYAAKRLNMIQRPDFDPGKVINTDIDDVTVEKMKGYWTIAVFGVDARDRAIAKGTNADVNLICNINQDTGEIKLVSVFRDTYLNISDGGSYNKINQAYFVGGPEQAVAALNRNLDLNITDYMTFNWKAVADAINILGGVDIELSKAEFYYINSFITETVKVTGIGSHHLKSAGMNHLDGVQAVAYGRLRLMDTDYARTERQRKVIAQAFEKAKKADFNTLNTIIGTVFPQIATSIGVDDMVINARSITKYHLTDSTGFPQARGDASMGKKGACVIPQTLESNVIQLHTFLFGDSEGYTPSKTVKNISSKIAADSGMYKEGKYVDKVSTEGGVIQSPKTTPAATKESTKSTSDSERETDENGETIKPTTSASGTTGVRPTPAETDEDGNPVETSPARPGESTEGTTGARPGGSTEGSTGSLRPGDNSESSTGSLRPGDNTVPTSGASRPGESTSQASTAGPGPGTSGSPTTAAPRPGESETTRSPEGSAGVRPGESSQAQQNPSGTTAASGGPGGIQPTTGDGVTTIIGTVGAPGQ